MSKENMELGGSGVWMLFIRGTVAIMWAVSIWVVKTLVSIDKNMAVMTQSFSTIERRVSVVEVRVDNEVKEKIENLRTRWIRNGRTN